MAHSPLRHSFLHMIRKLLLATSAASILASCSNTDNLRPCPFDKFFSESIKGNADYLYSRAYASLRSTDCRVHHIPEDQAGCDIRGTDGTISDFVRGLFNLEELASDEAICSWTDSGVYKYVTANPDEVSPSTAGFFLRVLSGIRAADVYLSRHEGLDPRRTAEVRLLRALYHLYILDIYGDCGQNVGLPAEVRAVGFIESEILRAMEDLPEPKKATEKSPEYGKMNRGVARALLMRLYLNHEVYNGIPRYADALRMAQSLIESDAYALSSRPSVVMLQDGSLFTWTPYQKLFMADNGRNGAQVEAILPLLFDKDTVATYAATSFLTGSTFDDKMYTVSQSDTLGQTNGTTLYWGGNRARPELVRRFTMEPVDDADTRQFQKTVGDDRALFFSKGRTLDIDRYTVFSQGYATTKFNALYAEGTAPSYNGLFSSSDFFLIRLAEAYMTAAEVSWRLGDREQAAAYVNALRTRANALPVRQNAITAEFLLDEWSREFYFEGRRRTDLRRFGQYFGPEARRWSWKGGERLGRDLPEMCNTYQMPDTATVGARYLELYTQHIFKKPADMYYVVGSGVVENSWEISGDDNFGLGLIPCAANDSDIVFIDYFKTSYRFKLIGRIGKWDEQYGSGDYGSFLHNEPLCEPINVPADGVYRVCVQKRSGHLTVLRYFGDSGEHSTVGAQGADGRTTPMTRCNMFNRHGHSWMCDLSADADGLIPPFRMLVDGAPQDSVATTYGIDSAYDEIGFISLAKVRPLQRVRVVYNDIMRSCYFYPIEPDPVDLSGARPDKIILRR